MREAAADPGVRAGRPAPRPADRRPQGHREAADGGRPQRGPRRHRHRRATTSRPRCRSSTCAGAGWWAARASWSTRSRTSTPGELVGDVLEGLYADAAARRAPKQVLVPDRARRPRLYARVARRSCAGRDVDDPGAAAGRQARAAGDRRPATPRRSSPATGLRRATDHNSPGPGPQRAAGRPRPARGPAAHRVLRHEPHPGHRLRRARWS